MVMIERRVFDGVLDLDRLLLGRLWFEFEAERRTNDDSEVLGLFNYGFLGLLVWFRVTDSKTHVRFEAPRSATNRESRVNIARAISELKVLGLTISETKWV